MRIIFILFLISCSHPQKDSNTKFGTDFHGKIKSCEPMKQKACTKILTEEDRFGRKCQADGFKAVQCDCHEWICIK